MGVRNRQKRRWLTGMFAVVISVVAVLFTRSVSDFNDRELPWANVNGVIPAVTSHSIYDTVAYNYLSPHEGDWEMKFDSTLASEQYCIVSDDEGVHITYGRNGEHRARATLFQLTRLTTEGAKLPYGHIDDGPAFAHRGVLMDVCRHFFTVEEVKRQLDIMALYKFNVLHWHLTEDQGWRIAMDKYPKLAEVAAFRMHGDSVYGGSYNRQELEEVVAYAKSLGIDVIPEIELPGHSQAALAAYPELGCTGEPVKVATDWGVFKDIYCAGNEQTFEFLEDVLDYVCEIFPYKYIHIGGDEAPKYRWEHCAKCQRRMKDQGLEDEEALQGWFNTRIENYLSAKGRQIIGWDEILEGGLSPNATVQSWRGFEGGIQAARLGHDVIMSPTSHAYFDYPISSIDVPKVYAYNPVPQDLDPLVTGHILGGECNLWSERITDIETLDQRFLPRGIAMAEVLWSNSKNRNYEVFWSRLQGHYRLLDALGYSYDVEQIPVDLQTSNESTENKIEIHALANPAFENLELNVQSSTGAVQGNRVHFFKPGIHSMSVQPSRDGRPMGPLLEYDFALHQGLLTHSCLTSPPTPPYRGTQDIPLANGVLGSSNFRDGNWLGYFGPDFFSGHFEWKEKYIIDSVKINFLQSRLSWILIPEIVYADIYVQSDVIERYQWDRDVSVEEEGTFTHTMTLAPVGGFPPTNSINFEIPNTERLSFNHPAAGQRVWHFLDEVQIYGRPYRN